MAREMRGKYVVVTLKRKVKAKAKVSALDLKKQGVLLAVDPDSGNIILLQVCATVLV